MPGAFAQIIGHTAACEVLRRMGEAGALPHALLIVGPDSVGKRAIACALLASVFPGDIEAHPDVVFVRRLVDEKTDKVKSAVSVEQIRQLTERLSLSAIGGGKKASLIEEADRMNAAAANSLLKTLEEPKGDALLILCAPTLESVPATIASRCQLIRLHAVPRASLEKALVERGLAPRDASHIASLSNGRPGVALRLVADGQFRSELETASASLTSALNQSLAQRLRAAAELLPKEEANKQVVVEQLLDAWETTLREKLLQDVLAGADPVRWVHTLRTLGDTRRALRHNVNPQLALERVLISL